MGLLNRVVVQNWTLYCKFFRRGNFVNKLSSRYQCTSSSVSADSDQKIVDFEKYSITEDFLASSKDAILDVISRDDLKMKDESRIFSAAMRWVMREKDVRQQYTSDLLNHVRYPYILKDPSPLYLFYLVKHKIPEIASLHEKQRNYWKLTYGEKLQHHRQHGLRPRRYDEVLVSLPGNKMFKMQEKSKTYAANDSTNKTISLKNFIKFDYFVFEDGKVKLVDSPFCYYDSEGRKPAAMHMVDNGLGVVMVTQDADTWVLDYRSGPVMVAPMLKDAADRRSFAANPYIEGKNTVRLNDRLYFFHYRPRSLKLLKIFCYDMVLDAWSEIPSPLEDYTCVSVTACNGKIYASNGAEPFLLAYDPTTEQWSTAVHKKPKEFFDSVTLASANNNVYILSLQFWPQQDAGKIFKYDTMTREKSVAFSGLPANMDADNNLAVEMFTCNDQLFVPQYSQCQDSATDSVLTALHQYDPVSGTRRIVEGFSANYSRQGFRFQRCWNF